MNVNQNSSTGQVGYSQERRQSPQLPPPPAQSALPRIYEPGELPASLGRSSGDRIDTRQSASSNDAEQESCIGIGRSTRDASADDFTQPDRSGDSAFRYAPARDDQTAPAGNADPAYDNDTDTDTSTNTDTDTDTEPAKSPILEGFTPEQEGALRDAYAHTKRMVDSALDTLHTSGPDENFQRWFGKPTEENVKEVDRVLTNMDHALAKEQFTIKGHPDDVGNELAHMRYDTPHQIDLRPHFWDNVFGKNQSEATIAHELSHFPAIGGTRDHMYGPGAVQQLARDNPSVAMHNAENYGMFIRAQTAA